MGKKDKNSKELLKFLFLIVVIILLALIPTRKTKPFEFKYAYHGTNQSPQVNTPPSPYPSPGALSLETIRRENPSKTRAFFYTSLTPAFSGTEASKFWKYRDDPFEARLNGDTRYFTANNYKSWEGTNQVKPMIVELRSNRQQELLSIDKGSKINGYTQITRWIDDDYLLSRSCEGDLGGGCDFDLIDVRTDTSHAYARFLSQFTGLKDHSIINQVKNYIFSQDCNNGVFKPCQIKVYKDVVTNDLSKFSPTISPIQIIDTSKYMVGIDMVEDNVRTINRYVRIYLSSSSQERLNDGSFLYDLENGTLIESNNL